MKYQLLNQGFYYVELFRYQLKNTLGYKTTMALPFKSTTGTPQYSLVFATDHDAGKKYYGVGFRQHSRSFI